MIRNFPTPDSILFTTTLSLSIIIIITATNWIYLWLSIELNIISLIPFIFSSNSTHQTEAAINYFLIQTISSSLLLIAICISISNTLQLWSAYLMLLSLIINIGSAPCHFWLPQVINNLSWIINFTITTIQNIGPLALLVFLTSNWNPLVVPILAVSNAAVGSLGGINQTQIRPLLAYSSIAHLAWILSGILVAPWLTMTYFSIYTIISMPLFLSLTKLSNSSTSQLNILLRFPASSTNTTLLNLISLGGLPPLIGFIPNWITISLLAPINPMLSLFLVISSIITLYYYLTIVFTSIINSLNAINLSDQPSLLNTSTIQLLPTILLIFSL